MPSDLAKEIKHRREEKQWSINELATKAGLDASYLNRMERGKLEKDPSEDAIRKISNALGLADPKPLLLKAGSAPTLSLEQAWANTENRDSLLSYLEKMKKSKTE